MRTIAIDEAGYTGQDLTNKDQPVFVLSSVNFTIDEAHILSDLITSNAIEFKFNKLKKYKKFENELEFLLNHELISDKTVKLAIAHKEYMIIAQIVNNFIEAVFYHNKIDIYKEGTNLALTNLLYYTLPVFCDKNLIDKLYNSFIRMFRKKTDNDINVFYETIRDLIISCKSSKLKQVLNIIFESSYLIKKILVSSDKFYLDASTPSFVALIDFWGKSLKAPFDIIADVSKPLMYYQKILSNIMSKSIKEKEIGYGSRKMQLPLKVNNFHFKNSKDYLQIQIADLIAGASAHYGKSLTKYGKRDNISKIISESKISNLFFSPIWPHKAVTPDELNMDKSGNNALDELGNINNVS